ncbi:EH domain-binding protein 1-like [Cyanocitta cristata]
MGSVWKRLQRAGKRAAKVRFEATLEELLLEGGGGWTPDRVTVVWSRRHRQGLLQAPQVAAGHPEPAAGNGRVGAARDPRGGRDPVPGPPGRHLR